MDDKLKALEAAVTRLGIELENLNKVVKRLIDHATKEKAPEETPEAKLVKKVKELSKALQDAGVVVSGGLAQSVPVSQLRPSLFDSEGYAVHPL